MVQFQFLLEPQNLLLNDSQFAVDRTPIMSRFPVAYSIQSWISSSYTSGYCQIYTRGE